MPLDRRAARAESRAELGRFLRARRAELDPAEQGLPLSPRRRATGLLREEVAALAGMSTTWYTYLEQGRPISPSSAVLTGLARALQLDEDQTRYVQLLLFGQTSPARPLAAPDLALWPSVVANLGATDSPFYAANQYGEMLAWNPATTLWYTDFAALEDQRRNMLWWLLCAPEAKAVFPEWEYEARDLVGRLRAAFGERPDDPRLRTVITTLRAESQEFRGWWDEQHVVEQRARLRQLCHPQLGRATFQLVALRVPEDPGVGYLAHLPVDPPPNSTL